MVLDIAPPTPVPRAVLLPVRRQKMDPLLAQQILRVYWTERCSLRELADAFGLSHMAVWRLVRASTRPNG